MGDQTPDGSRNEYNHQDAHQGNLPQYAQQHAGAQLAFLSQLDMAHSPATARPGPYNMTGMASALPSTPYRSGGFPGPQQHQQQHHQQQQRFAQGGSSPTVMPQMFPQQNSVPVAGQHYYLPQQAQMPQYYQGQVSPTQQQHGRPSGPYYHNQGYVNHAQGVPMPSGYYYPPTAQYGGQGLAGGMVPGQYMGAQGHGGDLRFSTHSPTSDATFATFPSAAKGIVGGENQATVVRGPPRKPRQSGHAIWIGNLPPQTDLMSLVYHVCREAPGLESLFLISKSNCAFANYKDEPTCVTAQQKLHDSKFQAVRLVSRLRKSTVEGAAGITAPTGPAAAAPAQTAGEVEKPNTPDASEPLQDNVSTSPSNEGRSAGANDGSAAARDKFFILKSLTVEDLELSLRTGIWATQAHNESALNTAFKTSDNVYLVFSANKSGEYYGYARMTSAVNDDPAAAIEFAPKAQSATDVDLPKAIPTEATDFAPKGRIIDDSARGTIFWEAEHEDTESADDESDASSKKSALVEGDGGSKTWGKPFKLDWLSTARLPFYRTRGLRNPWNSNREVKIARDGTELEPSVGRKLIGLFNRVQSTGPVQGGMRPGMALVAGYPPMRPSYPS